MAKYEFPGVLTLVTGAASGIGRAVANAFAECGAIMIAADINLDGAKETVDGLEGKDHMFIKVDVSDESSVTELAKSIKSKYGSAPTVVIHAAGINIGKRTSAFEITHSEWNRVMDINLKGTFFINKTFGRLMRDDKIFDGAIVNFASIGSRTAYPRFAEYCISKAGVVSLTQNFALELAPLQIRVNAVSPGAIQTPLLDQLNEKIVQPTGPQKRIGKPEEVARACLFLASKESSYITGQVLTVSGGS